MKFLILAATLFLSTPIMAQETGPNGSVLRVPSTGGKARMGPLDLSSANATTNNLDAFSKLNGFTSGACLFGKSDGKLLQSAPANCFWDATNFTLGLGTITPDSKSLLDLSSTTRGFLAPRMTTAQRNAIVSPPNGLMIYNTTLNQYQSYNSSVSQWGAVGRLQGDATSLATSAAFQVDSTTKGSLAAPRMTTVQRDAITGAVAGLLIYNTTTNAYNVYNGSTWAKIGGGGSGSGGFIISTDGDAEGGQSGWTSSGGTFANTTTAIHVAEGTQSYSFDASAASQFVETVPFTVPTVLQGAQCSAQMVYKGGDPNLKIQAIDGSANILREATLNTRTSYNSPDIPTQLHFTCPSSGTVKFRIVSTADAAIIYFDLFTLGSLSTVAISQSEFVGSIKYVATANCTWTNTGASFANYAADTDCPTPTVTGNASAPATKIPGLVLANMPAGEYYIVAQSNFTLASSSSGGTAVWQFNDGINQFGNATSISGSTASGDVHASSHVIGRVTNLTARSNVTIQVQSKTANPANGALINNSDAARTNDFELYVYRYPLNSEFAVRVGYEAWKVDANIVGANIQMANATNVTSYIAPENASLTLVNNSGLGNIGAMIPCSGVNPATGTTCSVGNEQPGLSFTPLGNFPQDIQVCAEFTHDFNLNTSSNTFYAFQIVETLNNSQTIIQEGKSRIESGATSGSFSQGFGKPINLCGTFTLTSPGQRTFRVMYETSFSGSGTTANLMLADGAASVGQRDIHMTARPLTMTGTQLVIPSGVLSNATTERIERIRAAGATDVTACTASPCTQYRESGDWVNTFTRLGTGRYVMTIHAGIFSAPPVCLFVSNVQTRLLSAGGSNCTTATDCTVNWDNLSLAGTDAVSDIICMGPR